MGLITSSCGVLFMVGSVKFERCANFEGGGNIVGSTKSVSFLGGIYYVLLIYNKY